MTEKHERHICPVCNKYMFESHMCPVCHRHMFDFPNSFDECPVCGWMDDAVQEDYPDWANCANDMSLNQAREAWKQGKRVE